MDRSSIKATLCCLRCLRIVSHQIAPQCYSQPYLAQVHLTHIPRAQLQNPSSHQESRRSHKNKKQAADYTSLAVAPSAATVSGPQQQNVSIRATVTVTM